MPPLISVVIPSFNSAFIKECVDSVLSQTFENFELIIVDSSTEPFRQKVVEESNHPKITLFHRSGRHLPGSNRNFGIERASGEFVVCLDADDIIEPTFLEEALFVMCCMDYSLVGTSFRYFGSTEKTVKLLPHPKLEHLADGNAFVVTILFRKELWRQLGGFKDNVLGRDHIPEDWDFFVRALAIGATLYNRGTYGFHYRKHPDSLTAQPDMPSVEEMRERIRARHACKLSNLGPEAESVAPVIRKHGWKGLLVDKHLRQTVLSILPEQINSAFIDRATNLIAANDARLTVLSTCQMETYPEEFLKFLVDNNAEMFSLPDFLEDKELWLEFIGYLKESRNIIEINYGQNCFFIDRLSALSELFPSCSFNYISRY